MQRSNSIQRCLAGAVGLWLMVAGPVWAESRDVISQGIGYNIGQAAQNAAENALMQVTSTLLEHRQIVDKLESVQLTITAQSGEISPNPEDYPQGSIDAFEIVGNIPTLDFTRVTARVKVNATRLAKALQAPPPTAGITAPATVETPDLPTPRAPEVERASANEPDSETPQAPEDFYAAITETVLGPVASADAFDVSVGQIYESADDSIREIFGKLSENERVVEFLVRVSLTDEYLRDAERLLRQLAIEERLASRPGERFRVAIGTVFDEKRATRNEYISWKKVASERASAPAETFYFEDQHNGQCDRFNDYVETAGIYRGWKDENLNRVQVEFLDAAGTPIASHQLIKTYNYRANPPVAVRGVSSESKHPLRSGWGMIALLSSPGPNGSFLPDRSGLSDNTQLIFSSDNKHVGCPGILITPSTQFIVAAKVPMGLLERTSKVRVSYQR